MVTRGHFAIVKGNGPPCTRSSICLQSIAEIWFLSMADQPTSAALKKLEQIANHPLPILGTTDHDSKKGKHPRLSNNFFPHTSDSEPQIAGEKKKHPQRSPQTWIRA